MAWLRNKKRTLDLSATNNTEKKVVKNSTRKHSMNDGHYKNVQSESISNDNNKHTNNIFEACTSNNKIDNSSNICSNNSSNDSNTQNNSTNTTNDVSSDFVPTATPYTNNKDANDSNRLESPKFMNGVLSTSPCAAVESGDLLTENENIPELSSVYGEETRKIDAKQGLDINKNVNNIEITSTYTQEEDIILAKRTEISHEQEESLSEMYIDDSDSSRSLSPVLDHSIDENVNIAFHSFLVGKDDDDIKDENVNINEEEGDDDSENEMRDSFSELTLKSFQIGKNFNRVRHSLDSQMALLPNKLKSNLKVNSTVSLDERNEETDDDEEEEPKTLKKKSISWASNLETVHEFEKIKGRKLSLSSLFRKF